VRAHAGLVRCGSCRGIFDAYDHLIEGALKPRPGEERVSSFESPQTILAGLPAVAQAPTIDAAAPSLIAAKVSTNTAQNEHGSASVRNVDVDLNAARATTQTRRTNTVAGQDRHHAGPAIDPAPSADDEAVAFKWRTKTRLTPWQRVGFSLASIIAVVALVGQSLYWFRDELSGRFPRLKPTLTALCEPLRCSVSPPKRAADLGFVGADLSADAAHRGLMVFTATLKNSGTHATAFPSLVITLDGVGGEPLARRVFAPAQYAPANANLLQGIEAGGEMEIKLYLDTNPMTPLGFKVDHAYL
jgi:hypothetical protein